MVYKYSTCRVHTVYFLCLTVLKFQYIIINVINVINNYIDNYITLIITLFVLNVRLKFLISSIARLAN